MPDSQDDSIRDAYDVVAQSYANLLPDTAFEATEDLAMVDHFVGLIPVDSGKRVLDVGCGTGRMIAYLSSIDPHLHLDGIDISSEMIEQAYRAHPTKRFVVGDLARMPYASNSFDGLLAWYSIIHTPTELLRQRFSEMGRVLGSGGVVLAAFHVGHGRREITNAYGHSVTMSAFLHRIVDVEHAMRDEGFRPTGRLERAPRPTDRYPQGFAIGVRS